MAEEINIHNFKPVHKLPSKKLMAANKYLVIPAITLVIYILTKNNLTGGFRLHLALVSIIGLLIYSNFLKKKGLSRLADKRFVYLLTTVILLIVASTGWFFSPFFFALYLWAIFLSLLFSPIISLAFTGTLILLFSFNIGEVDIAYNLLVVLSLLTTIPLSFYLRKEYLKLKKA